MSWLTRLGFGTRTPTDLSSDQSSSIAQGPDDDIPAPGQQFAQFGAGCFWGVELAFQRLPGVTKTEVGYTQGFMHNPSYNDVCSGTTNHNEVVRVQYDPKECSFESLLDCNCSNFTYPFFSDRGTPQKSPDSASEETHSDLKVIQDYQPMFVGHQWQEGWLKRAEQRLLHMDFSSSEFSQFVITE
ncbi:Peptide methionine sulfoxide reductase [Artemisia annua]|uniref:peptide-methionine (S)-S-oxide reductase n=1 Tax=Artemisia annua TaxID=35608 RepID=A0A2U1KN58_ARTAN|nr:Peptide methionine sulfoxide reductase [Artemisia annua]